MAANAQKCDACGRMQYGVERVALFVGGQPRVERDLCRSCRTEAIDHFLAFDPFFALPRRTGIGSRQ